MLWEKKARPAMPARPRTAETLGTKLAMLWERKARPATQARPQWVETITPTPAATPKVDTTSPDTAISRAPNPALTNQHLHPAVLGQTLVLRGEVSGKQDLVIDGQFEGSVDVPEHSLTVGTQGKVKAEIRARQVIVFGSVEGKITARDKIDLRKTGNVVGDLISAGVSIEEGAYFKGGVEIVRELGQEKLRSQAARAALPSVV
jgi:cytoskeletal protein CcmA (bactofilin family)